MYVGGDRSTQVERRTDIGTGGVSFHRYLFLNINPIKYSAK